MESWHAAEYLRFRLPCSPSQLILQTVNPLAVKNVSVIDHEKTGAGFRVKRERRRISLRALGKKLNLSAAYISDLERGRANWSASLSERFLKVLR